VKYGLVIPSETLTDGFRTPIQLLNQAFLNGTELLLNFGIKNIEFTNKVHTIISIDGIKITSK